MLCRASIGTHISLSVHINNRGLDLKKTNFGRLIVIIFIFITIEPCVILQTIVVQVKHSAFSTNKSLSVRMHIVYRASKILNHKICLAKPTSQSLCRIYILSKRLFIYFFWPDTILVYTSGVRGKKIDCMIIIKKCSYTLMYLYYTDTYTFIRMRIKYGRRTTMQTYQLAHKRARTHVHTHTIIRVYIYMVRSATGQQHHGWSFRKSTN